MARRRLALCVGINDYPGTDADLAGCVNDALDWELALVRRGYETTLLLDGAATKGAVVAALAEMVGQARYGDRVVFQYSGHGTWLPDRDGDEADSRDEALVMHDFREGGLLVDDELQAILGMARFGVRRLILSDSCHSGSVSRFMATGHDPVLMRGALPKPRFLPPASFLEGPALELAEVVQHAPARGVSRPGTVLISGCADTEYSYDASFGGRPNGAFTKRALEVLDIAETKGFAAWHRAIREVLPNTSHPQTPQLTAKVHQRGWRL